MNIFYLKNILCVCKKNSFRRPTGQKLIKEKLLSYTFTNIFINLNMFLTAYNILGVTEEVKKDFVTTFSAQTTEVDKKLGQHFAMGNIEFGTVLSL